MTTCQCAALKAKIERLETEVERWRQKAEALAPGADDDWAVAFPKMTPQQRRMLAALASGTGYRTYEQMAVDLQCREGTDAKTVVKTLKARINKTIKHLDAVIEVVWASGYKLQNPQNVLDYVHKQGVLR